MPEQWNHAKLWRNQFEWSEVDLLEYLGTRVPVTPSQKMEVEVMRASVLSGHQTSLCEAADEGEGCLAQLHIP